ncbi:UDP-N-acetylmuramate--L-alanine ligase [Cerasicoccus frondis]|uniref:UDP-N-acetylmuramate--L-alanine ligase n=1 Tax=Cerasicoccus frondis TaxID=490090 RepID=UPI002852BB00|nr:Mur ligase family protein [Cerasicoccus frondis]
MHLYFMGICGTAMGNVALMMRELGHEVSGSDTGIYPPMSDLLRDAGVEILDGWDPERLAALKPDQVVVGNAISRGNPEIEWLLATRALPIVSLPALLSETTLSTRQPIVITGTHGKTTTSALTAYILREHRAEPGWLVGGVPRDLPNGAHAGESGRPFVIEGDEYDSAFFDKRSKFVHYQPRILAVNNLEFDHGDIFRDLADIQRSFSHVIRLVPRNGFILYNGDEENLRALLPVDWCACYSVGVGKGCDLRIENFSEDVNGASFTLRWRGTIWQKIQWPMHGLYNARNAAIALLAAGLAMKPDDPFCPLNVGVLANYQGVKRRQECLRSDEQLVVLEDFGHHPTAVAQVLESLRRRYPEHRITACFEPRSNTGATNVFQDRFTDALALADAVYLGPVFRGERYAEDRRLNTAAMADELNQRGVCSGAFADFDSLLAELFEATRTKNDRPRCVVFFSNGGFGGIHRRFADEMSTFNIPVT